MDKMLKQDEIDALFEAPHDDFGGSAQRGAGRVVPYNFSSSGQISNEAAARHQHVE